MTIASYAVIAAGVVENVVLWDGGADWTPPANTTAVLIPSDSVVGIGYAYANNTFTAPTVTAPTLTTAQIAANAYAALISGGVTVTSTSTPALNGVYPIDPQAQSDITTEASFIASFSVFTTGGTTNLPWQLANGSFVQFPTTTEFLAFAKAVGQLVAAAKLAAAQMAAMPSAVVTIP